MQSDTPGCLHGIDMLHVLITIVSISSKISSNSLPGLVDVNSFCEICLSSLVTQTTSASATASCILNCCNLQHAVQTCQSTNPCAIALLQAKYHGIALTVNPDKLTPVNGKPLQQAIERVLHDPIFKVWH